MSSQHWGKPFAQTLPTWTNGEERWEAGTVAKWEGLLCRKASATTTQVSGSRIFSLSGYRVMKLWTSRKVVRIECTIVKQGVEGGGLTVVAVLVMNRHIVALRRLIVAAESERWYDATLAPVICNRRLCASGWGLLSLPSLPSLPNCKLIIFFQITATPPPPPPKLRRASCQMLQWAGFIWKSTCRRTLMCLKHLNVALSRTGSEYRCAAGTQIACFLMKQVFGCISCCMLKHHRGVSPNDHPVYTVILPTDWELGCWCLAPAGIVAGPRQTTPFQTAGLAHLPTKV